MLEPDQVQIARDQIKNSFSIMQVAATQAIEYLALVNGGGVIACLTLISSDSPAAQSIVPTLLALSFIIGLSLLGAVIARGAKYATEMTLTYTKNFIRATAGEITFDDLQATIDVKAGLKKARINAYLLWLSLLFALLPTIGGGVWLILVNWYRAPVVTLY